MLTKIIVRSFLLLAITVLFACESDDTAITFVDLQGGIATEDFDFEPQYLKSNIEVTGEEYQPTGCTYVDCNKLLPELSEYYHELANKTCKVQWYCASCCLNEKLIDIKAYVEPDDYDCFSSDNEKAASAVLIPNLPVAVLPNHCFKNGATLWAVNPKLPGNPTYLEPIFTIKWYKNGEIIAQGANLSDCICDDNVSVRVYNTMTGAEGEAMYLAKPCNYDEL